MASIKIKGIDELFVKIKNLLTDLPETMYDDIEKIAVERIVAKARTGKTMAHGEEQDIKPLTSKPYMDMRKQIISGEKKRLKGKKSEARHLAKSLYRQEKTSKGKKEIDPDFFRVSGAKSNLTFSGQYLRSFKKTKIDRKNGKLRIEAVGERKDGKITNSKLSGYLVEQGRSIFGLDSTAKKRIFQRVIEELRRLLKK